MIHEFLQSIHVDLPTENRQKARETTFPTINQPA